MKMINNTSTTSTSGVTLISFLTPWLGPTAIDIATSVPNQSVSKGWLVRSAQLFRHDIEELVRGLRDIDGAGIDPALEEVVEHHRGNRDQQSERGRHQRFRNTCRHRTEKTDEGGSRANRGEQVEASFETLNLPLRLAFKCAGNGLDGRLLRSNGTDPVSGQAGANYPAQVPYLLPNVRR